MSRNDQAHRAGELGPGEGLVLGLVIGAGLWLVLIALVMAVVELPVEAVLIGAAALLGWATLKIVSVMR